MNADLFSRRVLVCQPCRVGLVLGDLEPAAGQGCEHITQAGRGAHEMPVVSTALWRFIAEHGGERLEVVHEAATHFGDGTPIPADLALIEPVTVGTPDLALGDTATVRYSYGWPHRPVLRSVAAPLPTVLVAAGTRPREGENRDQRATRRPGSPVRANRDQAVYIAAGQYVPWLSYLLAVAGGHWILDLVTESRFEESDGHRLISSASADRISEDDVEQAQQWAQDEIERGLGEDAVSGFVTEWRRVRFGDEVGWVPLFDDTYRTKLPWSDLQDATGRRHVDRATIGHTRSPHQVTS